MPSRRDVFVNGGIYHIFNKTLDDFIPFSDINYSVNFLRLLEYYRSAKAKMSFSKFKILDLSLQKKIMKEIMFKKYFKVEILAYCLMPNHYHFLLKQKTKQGVIKFVSDVLNSFTRYFNLKNERRGPLFLPQFKSKVIKSEEQLIHVSRYIHLNPYTNNVVDNIKELGEYSLSSLKEYINNSKSNLCDTDVILSSFNYKRHKYKEFVFNNTEYQKTLEYIKHMEKWL